MRRRRSRATVAEADATAIEPEIDVDVDASAGAPATEASTHSPVTEVGAIDVERALRLVRIAIGIIGAAAVIGARDQAPDGLQGPAAAAAIFGAVAAVNAYTAWTTRRGWRTAAAIGGQVLDCAGALGLVLLLDQALDGSSWMLMLLPIVMGGVRLGAGGTLLAWTLGSAGYLALVLGGVIDVSERPADAFGVALQRFAFLLAIAVPVAALTQWMQQRWEHQRSLTVAAAARARRLELIEAMARSFVGSSEPRLLANLADAGVQFGFTTVTITMQAGDRATTVATVGETRWLPTDDVVVRPEAGETLVTHWSGPGELGDLTSVSVALDTTGKPIVVHGWSAGTVDEDLAGAFGLLGAHAGVALRAARVLANLEREARQDGLTGLLNRRAFDAHLERLSEARTPVAMLLLDVDHFKQINDTYGHLAGDQVLRVIAERLRASIRFPDGPLDGAVARLGGDEFAVVISDAPLERVADVAERIERSMQDPVAVEGVAVTVSFSIGIADAEGTWLPRELVRAADEAAYQAKAHGRNRTCWSDGPLTAPAGSGPPASGAPTAAPAATPSASASADPFISLIERSIEPSSAHLTHPTTPIEPTPPRHTP